MKFVEKCGRNAGRCVKIVWQMWERMQKGCVKIVEKCGKNAGRCVKIVW